MILFSADDVHKRIKRDIGTSNESRYIGGGRDKSAPTDGQIILLKVIIGGAHDTSGPTVLRRIMVLWPGN